MDKKLKFSVDNVEISGELDTSRFTSLNIECFATGDNAHNIIVSEEALRVAEDTIFNIPIVWHYDSVFDDASGHDIKEVPCGFIPKDSVLSYEVQDDGRVMFVISGALIWKKYTGKLMDIFEREDGKKGVSVEISIGNYEDVDDVMEIIDFSYEAITVLGELYEPAIPGANAEITEFAEKETKEFKDDFKKEFLFSRKDYLEVDFSIPKGVKEVILDGVSMMEENDIKVDSVILRYSDHMYEKEFLSPAKATYILKHLERFKSEVGEEEINKSYVSWMLLGGGAGDAFLSNTTSKMKEVDNRLMNYFELYRKEEEIDMAKKTKKTEIDKKDVVDKVVDDEKVFAEEQISEEEVVTEEVFEDDSKEEEEDDDAMMAEESEDEKEEEDSKSKSKMADEEKENEEKEEEFSDEKPETKSPTKEDKAKFALNASQMYEVLRDALSNEYCYIETHDDEYVYIYDYMEESCFRVPYSVEDNKATLDMDSKEKVISGGYELVGSGKEEFSLNSYLDVPATLAFLESETEDYKEIAKIDEEFSIADSAGKLMKAMFEKIQSLADFKDGVEKSQFAYEVETTLNEVKGFMSKADIEELKIDSGNYSLENIDGWKNAVKAAAFEGKKNSSENKEEEEEEEIKKFSLPFDDAKGVNESGMWD